MKIVEKLPFYLRPFLVVSLVVTLLCGLIFATAQQIYRQSANDPQIQISEDMASYLSANPDPTQIMPKMDVDISKSLVWFVMVFDDANKVKVANAKLDGQTPVVPAGALEHAKQNGQNRVTWEPKEGVRIAAVITKYNGGTVLIGRSLRETEERVEVLGKKVIAAWLITLATTFLATWFLIPNLKKSH